MPEINLRLAPLPGTQSRPPSTMQVSLPKPYPFHIMPYHTIPFNMVTTMAKATANFRCRSGIILISQNYRQLQFNLALFSSAITAHGPTTITGAMWFRLRRLVNWEPWPWTAIALSSTAMPRNCLMERPSWRIRNVTAANRCCPPR